MSAFTDARSRPGTKGVSGTDDRQLFLTEFGGIVLESYEEALDYQDKRWVKNITQGKADTFPVIGRKRDASEHTPGEQILGGTVAHDEVPITLDNILFDAIFVADVDTMMLHYDIYGPYAKQLGQSLGVATAKRIAIMHILASRGGVTGPDQPVPAYAYRADLLTNGASLESVAFAAQLYMKQNDMSGEQPFFMLPHAQVTVLARYAGLDNVQTSGSANRSSGTIGMVAGMMPTGTNHIPNSNITSGLAKYQGNFSTTVGHIGSRMAVGTLERMAMKVTMKEQEDRIGTLMLATMFNGHGKLRNECSIELRTDAIAGRTTI